MSKYEYIETCFRIADQSFLPEESNLRTINGPVSRERIQQQIRQDRSFLTEPVAFWGYTWHTLAYAIRHMKEYRTIIFEVLSIVENVNNTFVAVQKHKGIIRFLIPVSESFLEDRLK